MNRHGIAARLSLMVALAGLVPIAVVGVVSIDLLRRRVERTSQQALQVLAQEAAARISEFLTHQRELLRAVAAVTEPGGERRLEEVILDAPSLGRVTLVGPDTPDSLQPKALRALAVSAATERNEVASDVYLNADNTPAMDICVPAQTLPRRAVCAELDLLELWRFVQHLRIGASGYALAFDSHGRLVASGSGALRPAVLTGEPVPESTFAASAARGTSTAPTRYKGAEGKQVIAGWARLPEHEWAVVVEQPVQEALRSAQTAQWLLGGVLLIALLMSVGVGVWQSQRVLRELEVEERWRTAGRIAAGITHDLGHRLRVLEQTAGLADAGDPAFLPRIRENLRSELGTLQKFVSEFSDLSRNLRSLELMQLELGAFLESIRTAASPLAKAAKICLQTQATGFPFWVRADRHLLERAILNLITNAIEASPPGGMVQLSAVRRERACGIEVADRGSGIAPDRLPLLFDAFASTKRTGAHLGMGLPNVKRIIDAHGGSLSVESQPGLGTTFRILLPERPPMAEGEPDASYFAESGVTAPHHHRPS